MQQARSDHVIPSTIVSEYTFVKATVAKFLDNIVLCTLRQVIQGHGVFAGAMPVGNELRSISQDCVSSREAQGAEVGSSSEELIEREPGKSFWQEVILVDDDIIHALERACHCVQVELRTPLGYD
jgi:hypothetical protein